MTRKRYTNSILDTFKLMVVVLTILFTATMASNLASAGQVDNPAGAGRTADAGIWLAACKPPPLPTRGCIRNPCDGKYICCSESNGRPKCVIKEPPKK